MVDNHIKLPTAWGQGRGQGHGEEYSVLCNTLWTPANLPVPMSLWELKSEQQFLHKVVPPRIPNHPKSAGTTTYETHALKVEILARGSLHACRDCRELGRQAFRLGDNLRYPPLRLHSSNERHVSPKVSRAFLRAETIDNTLEG